MIIDGLNLFTGISNGASGAPASGANTDAPTTGTQVSANIIDLGVINGLPTSARGGGARDIAIGDDPMMKLLVQVTTAFASGTNLQVNLQGAPDNGSGAPGSFTTMWSSPAVVEANLTQGAYIANIDVPRPVPGQPVPRYLQLQYVSSGTHTAGAIEGAIVLDRFDQMVGATGALSGYAPGVTVAN